MDRLEDVLVKSEPAWHLRKVLEVLLEEDYGYGSFPAHKDLSTVGDLLRLGANGLSIRFREVDPDIWQWLIDELGGKS